MWLRLRRRSPLRRPPLLLPLPTPPPRRLHPSLTARLRSFMRLRAPRGLSPPRPVAPRLRSFMRLRAPRLRLFLRRTRSSTRPRRWWMRWSRLFIGSSGRAGNGSGCAHGGGGAGRGRSGGPSVAPGPRVLGSEDAAGRSAGVRIAPDPIRGVRPRSEDHPVWWLAHGGCGARVWRSCRLGGVVVGVEHADGCRVGSRERAAAGVPACRSAARSGRGAAVGSVGFAAGLVVGWGRWRYRLGSGGSARVLVVVCGRGCRPPHAGRR
jgi:hypothetical protein